MGLGLNGGGVAAVRFLLREQAREIIVTDLHDAKRLAPSITAIPRARSVRYRLGGHRLTDFTSVDYVIKNPDVPWSSRYVQAARKAGIPVLSDIIIFFDRATSPIIGITGTKGKSTTTALIAEALRAKYRHVAYGGNVRYRSPLEIITEARHADYAVLELSSFQLEDLETIRRSPHIAIITSIAPDHLNRHGSFSEYKRVKTLITKFQNPQDIVIVPPDHALQRMIKGTKARKIVARKNKGLGDAIERLNPYLAGHMGGAAAIALSVASALGVPEKAAMQRFARFKALEGRRQRVRVLRGVTFINDTTATVPTAAAADLSFYSQRAPVVLIAGGMDKKVPTREFTHVIAKLPKAVVFLPGTATDRFLHELPSGVREKVELAQSMEAAVEMAFGHAKRGDIVLLAPGGTSFNLFFNEFHRGEEFVRAVKRLA